MDQGKQASGLWGWLAAHGRMAGFLVLVLIALGLPQLSPVRVADLAALDGQFALLRNVGPKPVESARDVVVVGIDDGTYKAFREPFALWHGHFGDLFKALAQARPAGVGLDVNLPDRSFNFLIDGIDQELLRGILALKKAAPLVLGLTVDQSGRTRRVYPPFLSVAGQGGQGYVLWRRDADRVVRRFTPRVGKDGETVPTLIGQLAGRMELEAERGIIDFLLGPPFDYVPMQDVVAWAEAGDTERLKATFGGRPVLVGSVLPFVDRHFQPVDLAGWEENDNYVPGVLIHAQALRTLMQSAPIQAVPTLAVTLLCLLLTGGWWLARGPWGALAIGAGVLVALAAGQAVLLQQGWHLPVVAAALTAALALGGRVSYEAVVQVLERQRLRRSFGGYVSPQVMEEILNGTIKPGLYGEHRTVCLLFSDVRSFTTLSEHLPPEEVVHILNRYFEHMTAAIQDNGGTIDKFMGDGIMAFFGAPKAVENPSRQAFDAAREKLRRLELLNREFEAEGRLILKIGIGLHTGEAIVGNVGSESRNEYTAIGDAVNTCSRLEGLTKEAGYPLVVSRPVAEALAGVTAFDSLGEMAIKGRAPVDVFGWPSRAESETIG